MRHFNTIYFFISFFCGLFLSQNLHAQVGIGTNDPQATLDVVGQPTDNAVLDGIIAPRLEGAELRSKTYTTAQEGAIVYVTLADPAPAGQTVNVTAKGYYQFDGAEWQIFSVGSSGASADTTTDIWVDDPANSRVELGAKSADGTTRDVGTEVVILDNGHQGLGITTPEAKIDALSNGSSIQTARFTANTVTTDINEFTNTAIRAIANPTANNTDFSVGSNYAAILEANTPSSFGNINENTALKIDANPSSSGIFNAGIDLTASPTGDFGDENIGAIIRTFPDANFSANNIGIVSQAIPLSEVNSNLGIRVNASPEGNILTNNVGLTVRNSPANGISIGQDNSGIDINMQNIGNYTTTGNIYGIQQTSAGSNPNLVKNYLQNDLGIGTNDPQATLDVVGQPTDNAVLDGIIAPRIEGEQLRAKTYTTAQEGAIVYVTLADPTPAGQTVNVTAKGYYQFDGAEWQIFSTVAAADPTSDSWVDNPTDARIELATLSDGTTSRDATTSLFYMRDDGKLIIGDPLSTGLNGENDNSGFVNIRRSSGTANLKLSSNDGSSIFFLEAFGTGEPGIRFFRSRGTDSDDFSTQLSVQDGDVIANEQFWGYNNNSNRPAEQMAFSAARRVVVDGSVTDNSNNGIPTKFTWRTSTNTSGPFTDNMVLDGEGRLGVGEPDPSQRLDILGQMQLNSTADVTGNLGVTTQDVTISGVNNILVANYETTGPSANIGADNLVLGTGVAESGGSIGNQAVVMGYRAARNNSSSIGNSSVAIGTRVSDEGSIGGNSVVIGASAATGANLSSSSTAIGTSSANGAIWNRSGNVALGSLVAQDATWNGSNVGIGNGAAQRSIFANGNIAIGEDAGAGDQAAGTTTIWGNGNISMGTSRAGGDTSLGNGNVLIGIDSSGSSINLTDNNVLIGSFATSDGVAPYSNSVALGAYSEITSNNQIVIGATSTATNPTQRIDLNANVSGIRLNGAVHKSFKFGNTVEDSDYTIVLSDDLTLPDSDATNQGRVLVLCSNGSTRTVTGSMQGLLQDAQTGLPIPSFVLNNTANASCITVQATGEGRWWIIDRS